MENDITIVTAFFDIGRGNLPTEKHGRVLPHYQHRSTNTYFEYFNNLAKLQNDMVVYTTENFAEQIYNIRDQHGLKDKTQVVVLESYLPPQLQDVKTRVQEVMDSPDYYSRVNNPQLIEYWHSDYVLVNIFKSIYVTHAIDSGLVKNDITAWIDFGYCRNPNTITTSNKWTYDFDREKIHFFNIRDIEPDRPIDDIIFTGDVYTMGCHIVAGTKKWDLLKRLMVGNLELLLKHNLIDDDQTLMLMSYLMKPEEFELHNVDQSDWFIIFKNFNESK